MTQICLATGGKHRWKYRDQPDIRTHPRMPRMRRTPAKDRHSMDASRFVALGCLSRQPNETSDEIHLHTRSALALHSEGLRPF